MANKDTIGAEKIKLPVDETGNPDFIYGIIYEKSGTCSQHFAD